MRKKRICALILSLAVCSCSFVSASAREKNSQGSVIEMQTASETVLNAFSSAEERLSKMLLVKAGGGTELYVDTANADIAVVDTKSSAKWFSSPFNITGDGIASETLQQCMASQVRVSLLNASNAEIELSSYKDAVLNKQCSIYKTEKGISINMTLGREEQRRLTPAAIPASSMEKYILPLLSDRALAKVKYFYKKYDSEKMTERQLKNISEKYPLVLDEPIYVLKSVTDTEAEEIEGYIKKTDYNFDLMEKDLKKIGIEVSENASPYVKLQIDYSIDKNGEFTASIDCGKIEYNSESFVLNKIYLLEYFMSADCKDESGFLVVPDGSGAVMSFNSKELKTNTELSLDIYGRDMALSYNNQSAVNENAPLPIYALSSANGSLFGFIENGAERCVVNASSGGTVTSLADACSYLTFCDVDDFDYTEIGSSNTWVISDKSGYKGKYSLRYKLLPENSSYSEIAVACRNVMVRDGHLKKSDKTTRSDLNIGLYGAVDYLDRIWFIPVNHLIPLTTVKDARLIVDELKSGGIDELSLRYIGWSSGGLKNSIAKSDVVKVVGTEKEIKEFAKYLLDANVGFYPDFSFQTVYKNTLFDGFLPSRDAVRMLNRQYANFYKMDMATNGQNNSTQHYLLNCEKVMSIYKRLMKKYDKLGECGISLSSMGELLYSDKNSKNPYGRDKALQTNVKIMKNAAESHSVMLDGGNSYTWAYADKIIGLPSSCGGFAQTDYSIPFVQTILHGYIPYTTEAINICGNAEQEFLKAAENGSQIYFELTAQNGAKLKNTDFSFAYSTDYHSWSDTIKKYYEKWNSAFKNLGESTIEQHSVLADGVSITTYSDGTNVIVNYTDADFTYSGTVIPSRDFVCMN